MIRRHGRPLMAHPQTPERLSLREYSLVALAAVVASPFTYVFLVVFLTWGGSR